MKTSRSRTALAALTASALMATACGSGKSDTSDAAPSDGGVTQSSLPECPVDAFVNESGQTEIVVWTAWVGATLGAFKTIADRYNQSQDKVVVRVENQGIDYPEVRKQFEAGVSAKQLPALVSGEDTWTQYMIDNGVTLPAQACIEADDDERTNAYDDVLPGVLSAYTASDVLWPAGFGASTVVLYFNKGHFVQAGLDPENPPRTYAELREASEKLQATFGATDPNYKAIALRLDSWMVENTTSASGETLVNNENGRNGSRATESTLQNDATNNMLTWYGEMKEAGLLNAIESSSLINHYLAVATQSSSMLLETSTASTLIDQITSSDEGLKIADIVDEETAKTFSSFDGFKVDFEVGLAPGPSLAEGKTGNGQVAGAALYMTNTGSDAVVSAAWDFMKFFMETEQQAYWTSEGGYMPIRTAAYEALEADPTWATSQRGTWISTTFESMKGLDPDFPGPLIGPYSKVRDTIQKMLEEIALGDAAGAVSRIEGAVATADGEITAALEQYNRTTR